MTPIDPSMMMSPNHASGRERLDTHAKALRVNLDQRRYGTFAEIGAGQEVVRWFFQVGAAAGTIAKSMSAYDMKVSDAVYGRTDRYVSRARLESMLAHEYQLNLERLSELRGDATSFFAFADTVSARNFKGTNECHGWMGVRYQVYPRDAESQVLMHVRMLDPSNIQQQEALGIVGVNLLYGAFFLHHEPEQLVESLLDGLGTSRVEIDLIEFSGIGFRSVDNRLMSLKLVQLGLSKAAMFDPSGKLIQPSEVFYKRPVLVERGSFRPVTHTNLDIIRAAKEKFVERLDPEDKDRVVTVAEITMRNLSAEGSKPDARDFLARADVLAASGFTVLVSDYFEFFKLAGYLRQFTKEQIGLALGAVTLLDVFDPKYYETLDGGILEALGRLFRLDLRLYVYPWLEPQTGIVRTIENVPINPELQALYRYTVDKGLLIALDNHDPECLKIFSRTVLKQIKDGSGDWEKSVPGPVAELIKQRGLFGYTKRVQ
jgi:hypothetical protein